MDPAEKVLFETSTRFARYRVVDLVFAERLSRVLFSGWRNTAQSGIPRDSDPRMLFDCHQRLLELVGSLNPEKVLLIGGGAFTLPTEIVNTFPDIQVDAVEQDAELEKIAEHFFGLKPSERLRIIIEDGREYLNRSGQTYDLILLDAYSRNSIPDTLATKEFAESTARHLGQCAVVAANVISAFYGRDTAIKQQYATYKSVFRHVDIYPADKTQSLWNSQNFILIATDNPSPPNYNLQFDRLPPPPTDSSDILHDH